MALHVEYMKLVDEDAQRAAKEWSQLFGDGSNAVSSQLPPFRGGAIVVNPENGSVSSLVALHPWDFTVHRHLDSDCDSDSDMNLRNVINM